MDYWEYYRRGGNLAQDGDYDAAIEVFSAYLNENPDTFSFLDRRAAAWEQKGEWDKAIADYTRMTIVKPDSPDGWNGRGNRYHEMGEYDKAIADYTEAIALMPDHASYWSNRGISYNGKEELDKALDDLNKAIAIDPEHSWALMHRGMVRRKKGDLANAISDLTRVLIYQPEDDWTLHERGYCWFMMKEFDKAITNFSAAIAVKGDDADLYLRRGACYYHKTAVEDMDKATEDFTKAIELDPNNAYAYQCRGASYRSHAWEHINAMKGVLMNRTKAEADRVVLMAQLEHIGYKKLVPLFNNALLSFRSNLTEGENIIFKMSSEMFQDYVADAVEDLTRAIALEPDNAESFYGRGLCHALAGDTHEALADYAQTLTLDIPTPPKNALNCLKPQTDPDVHDKEKEGGAFPHCRRQTAASSSRPPAGEPMSRPTPCIWHQAVWTALFPPCPPVADRTAVCTMVQRKVPMLCIYRREQQLLLFQNRQLLFFAPKSIDSMLSNHSPRVSWY